MAENAKRDHINLNRAVRKKRPTEDEQFLTQPQKADQPDFTDSDPWRVMRVMSEFVQGFDALADMETAVTIFGSARTKPDHPQYQQAVDLARALGEAGLSVITGGGPGIMQAGNQGAHEAGAHSVGLNIELPFEQHLNPYVDLSVDFRYFFVRKTMLVKYAQAFVIFPGGFGTMDELFEALTLIQTGKIQNFPVVLMDTDYWQGLIDWLRRTMLAEGKISAPDLDLIFLTDSIKAARDYIVSCLADSAQRQPQEESAREATRAVYEGYE